MASRARRVVWTHGAREDLDSILAFIAEDSPEAASDVLEVVLGVTESLSRLSNRGRVVPEVEISSIREVFIYSYRLLYEVTDTSVRVLSFVHGAREFSKWRRELSGE